MGTDIDVGWRYNPKDYRRVDRGALRPLVCQLALVAGQAKIDTALGKLRPPPLGSVPLTS